VRVWQRTALVSHQYCARGGRVDASLPSRAAGKYEEHTSTNPLQQKLTLCTFEHPGVEHSKAGNQRAAGAGGGCTRRERGRERRRGPGRSDSERQGQERTRPVRGPGIVAGSGSAATRTPLESSSRSEDGKGSSSFHRTRPQSARRDDSAWTPQPPQTLAYIRATATGKRMSCYLTQLWPLHKWQGVGAEGRPPLFASQLIFLISPPLGTA